MTVQAPATGPALPKARNTPPNVSLSHWWQEPDGRVIAHDTQMYVDATTMKITGELWVCPVTDDEGKCATYEWVFGPTPNARPSQRCCAKHPVELIHAPMSPLDAGHANPAEAASKRALSGLRERLDARRRAAVEATSEAAQAQAAALRQAALDAARRKHLDYKGHLPSAGVAAGALVGTTYLASLDQLATNSMISAALATFGAVMAYIAVYVVEHRAATAAGLDPDSRAFRRAFARARARARTGAFGAVAAGAYLALASAAVAALGPDALALAALLGAVLIWATCHRMWGEISQRRDSQREAARLAAEAAARRAEEEAERLRREAEQQPLQGPSPVPAAPAVQSNIEAGMRMREEWARICTVPTMPRGLRDLVKRTQIVVESTRELTTLVRGKVTHLGWEYRIAAEPGALTSESGASSVLTRAKDWLASVMLRDPATIEFVERPGGDLNAMLLLLTEGAAIGGIVPWKGREGLRVGPDGTLYGHVGQTFNGEDVEKQLWAPGQAGGGSRLGVTGSGKSVGTQIEILNDLVAGILPVLHDRKNLMDFVDFLGVIPMGCTVEHRDVIFQSLAAEMLRRQKYLGALTTKDRHGRQRRVEALWVPGRDGPPVRGIWEEFHLTAQDEEFVNDLETLVRLQRSSAIMQSVATQGGGLVDLGSSELRDQLNMIAMQVYRMSDRSAGLGGYEGPYKAEDLPPVPGAQLLVAQYLEFPIAYRGAYVHRKVDEDGSIFDHLYSPQMELLLPAPTLPPETLEVFTRYGLMDLWELGKGPNGYDNLTADTAPIGLVPMGKDFDASKSTKTAKPAAGGRIPAEEVVLGIILNSPGCGQSEILSSPLWDTAPGWGDPASISQINRVCTAMATADPPLVVRPSSRYTVTEEGRVKAMEALSKLTASAGSVAPDHRTPAEVERAIQRRAEALADIEREIEAGV